MSGFIRAQTPGFYISQQPGFFDPGSLSSFLQNLIAYSDFARNTAQASGNALANSLAAITNTRNTIGYSMAGVAFPANTPRRDATGLIPYEAAGTNAVTSNDLTTAGWTLAACSAATLAGGAPDGGNVSRLTSSGNAYFLNTMTGLSTAGTYVPSIFVRCTSGSYSPTFYFYQNNGGTLTIINSAVINVTTAWQRFQLPAAAALSSTINHCIQVGGNSGDFPSGAVFDVWCGSLEPGSVLTSPMPSGSRPADSNTLQFPSSTVSAILEFADASMQTVSVSGGAYTLPSALAGKLLKTARGFTNVKTFDGQVATACRLCIEYTTSYQQFNGRSPHIAREALSLVKISLPNWYYDYLGNNTEKAGAGGVFEASIEYPAGTFTRVTFAGSNQGTVAAGGDLESDFTAVSIPSGSTFWVRTFFTSGSGVVFHAEVDANENSFDSARGALCEFGTGALTSKVMGGTIAAYSQTTLRAQFVPTAIIQATIRPSWYLLGDSETYGYADTLDSSGDIGHFPREVGATFGYTNGGCGNDDSVKFIASHASRVKLGQKWYSHIGFALGVNDLRSAGGNRTAATVQTNAQTIFGYFTGKKFYAACAVHVATNSGGQTPDANNAQFSAYNNAVRAGLTGVTAFLEHDDPVATVRNSGMWSQPTLEGIHPQQAAYKAIAAYTANVTTISAATV